MPNPQKKKTHQELDEELYRLVSHCISAWASVDDLLFRIFVACVGPYEQCSIIYYRTYGLDVRIGLVNAIVRSVLPRAEGGHDDPNIIAWRRTLGDYQSLLGTRRRIARHLGSAKQQGTFWDEGYVEAEQESQSEIGALVRKHSRELSADKNPPLLLPDLVQHFKEVAALVGRLSEFFDGVLTKRNIKPAH